MPNEYHKMTLEQAKCKAREIMELWPGLSVCGSVSLMMVGLIEERPISDIDFECTKENLPPGCKNDSYGEGYNEGEAHSKVCGTPCNFFVSNKKIATFKVEGIPLSSLALTIKKKFSYWRPKDQKDLAWCKRDCIKSLFSKSIDRTNSVPVEQLGPNENLEIMF